MFFVCKSAYDEELAMTLIKIPEPFLSVVEPSNVCILGLSIKRVGLLSQAQD